MSATVHKLHTIDRGRVVRPTGHVDTDSSAYPTTPDGLSATAQQTLQIYSAMVASSGARTRPILKGMTAIEIAATFYASAVRYYQHPEQGTVQIQWSSVNALVNTNYPGLDDRLERATLMRDEQFHTAWQITEELMRWSGHLLNPEDSIDPMAHNPLFQPRSPWVSLSLPFVFLINFMIAFILPSRVRAKHDTPQNDRSNRG